MKPTFNEKLIAYLTLLSGLSISAVAVYYSVVGLTAIFAAAFIPIVIMGTVLEISKLVATVWLKQNWNIAPRSIKFYLMLAIGVLMFITSMGIFGFLSKAHLDQNLVSGDVMSKIAIYDEKIKVAKDNIEVNRRALKQMDEAVEQVMSRSTTESGADKAVAIRKSQARERARLLAEISAEQKNINALNEQRAPIAAEVRKVEAEVGPIKYIAAFVYDNTDPTILEKAVTWVIIIIIVVFDPLAVILLLASQMSFQSFRERNQIVENSITITEPDKEEPPVSNLSQEEISALLNIIDEKKDDEFNINDHPYLFKTPTHRHPPGVEIAGPQVYKQEIINDVELLNENTVTNIVLDDETISTEEISQTESLKLKMAREREEKIKNYVQQIKEGRLDLSTVPEELQEEVKVRV